MAELRPLQPEELEARGQRNSTVWTDAQHEMMPAPVVHQQEQAVDMAALHPAWKTGTSAQKLSVLPAAQEHILAACAKEERPEEHRQKFLSLVSWREFSQQLPEWMSLQVRHWREQAVSLDREERKIRHELEKSVEIELPIGVGALSWVILQRELRGWDRFHNRRQIASYTGLCPGIHCSNGRRREGSINRCAIHAQ